MPNNLDSIIARLQSKDYGTDNNALAADITAGIAALARQPQIDRGLKDQTLADVQGGTSLGVGEPSAGKISDYLIQNPQPGIPRDIGSGLRTRRQTRIETRTRVLPGKVMEAASPGYSTVRVSVVGMTTGKTSDPITGIEIVDNLVSPLASSVADIQGTEFDAAMTGQPIVSAGSTGIQPVAAGRTVDVAVSEQWEVTTTHTKRHRKSLPVVTRVLKNQSAALVNGLASLGRVCTIVYDAPNDNTFSDISYPDGDDWIFSNPLDASNAGQPWAVFVLGPEPSGTLDHNLGDFAYYDYGVVGPAGEVTFTGIPWSYAFANNFFSRVTSDQFAQVYSFFFIKGCAQGQVVNFGSAGLNYSWTDPSLYRTWNLIDTDFPIAL